MQITIQIADAVYQQILSNGKRVKGSIGLVNASEGYFNAHKPSYCGHRQKRVFRRLSHGYFIGPRINGFNGLTIQTV